MRLAVGLCFVLVALSASRAGAEDAYGAPPDESTPPPRHGGGAPTGQPLPNLARRKLPAPLPQEPAIPELTQPMAMKLAINYYAKKGEWAGAFVISNVTKVRLVELAKNRVRLFMDYDFRGIGVDSNGSNRRGETGSDSRTFDLEYDADLKNWTCTGMGAFQSGKQ